jgi:hypothetical protein
MRLTVAVLCALAAPARAEPEPLHVSIGGGGSLLLTGQGDGSRNRLDGHLGVSGGRFGRFGLVAALRHVAYDPFADDGLATIGLHYQAAAARPRLALALHADLGSAITHAAPVIGGGVETHFWIWPKRLGPIALVSDLTAHLVIDGVDDTRLVLAGATRLALAW